MGSKRKTSEGNSAGPRRSERKAKVAKLADTDNGDDASRAVLVTIKTAKTEETPENSDLDMKPRLADLVNVVFNQELGACINDNRQQLKTQVSTEPDPQIDIGDVKVEVEILKQTKQSEIDVITLEGEDEADVDSNMEAGISPGRKLKSGLPKSGSSSKAPGRRVHFEENGNETGATGGGKDNGINSADASVKLALNEQVEVAGSSRKVETPLIIQSSEVSVPSQSLTNKLAQLKQAPSSPPISISPQIAKINPQGKGTAIKPAAKCQCGDALAENVGLKLKVTAQQQEIEIIHKQLLEDNKELTWLKNRYVNNPKWNTELHLAAHKESFEVVKKLVEDGTYVNSRNKQSCTPIFAAAVRKDKPDGLKIIKYLIDNGADPYAKNNDNRTFLHNMMMASSSLTPTQFHDIATYLVSKNLGKLFTTLGCSTGIVPLQFAVQTIEVEGRSLKSLHGNGVDIKVLDKDKENNLLFYALLGNRSTKLMIDLVLLGVDWRHLNKDRRSLLHIASDFCHMDGVKYFLSLGLDVNAVDNFGDTPLHLAIKQGMGDVLGITRVLIENSAGVKIKNSDGCTPLDEAIRQNDDMPDKEKVIQLIRESE